MLAMFQKTSVEPFPDQIIPEIADFADKRKYWILDAGCWMVKYLASFIQNPFYSVVNFFLETMRFTRGAYFYDQH